MYLGKIKKGVCILYKLHRLVVDGSLEPKDQLNYLRTLSCQLDKTLKLKQLKTSFFPPICANKICLMNPWPPLLVSGVTWSRYVFIWLLRHLIGGTLQPLSSVCGTHESLILFGQSLASSFWAQRTVPLGTCFTPKFWRHQKYRLAAILQSRKTSETQTGCKYSEVARRRRTLNISKLQTGCKYSKVWRRQRYRLAANTMSLFNMRMAATRKRKHHYYFNTFRHFYRLCSSLCTRNGSV